MKREDVKIGMPVKIVSINQLASIAKKRMVGKVYKVLGRCESNQLFFKLNTGDASTTYSCPNGLSQRTILKSGAK